MCCGNLFQFTDCTEHEIGSSIHSNQVFNSSGFILNMVAFSPLQPPPPFPWLVLGKLTMK